MLSTHSDPKLSDLEQQLLNRKIQPTAIRLMVLDFMKEIDIAVSMADLETNFPKTDRTTLWRTLNTFHDQRLVHEIHDDSGNRKFALCREDCSCTYPADMHPHFYCSRCSKTFCFSSKQVPQVDLPESFQPASVNFVINGTCPSCTT